MTRYISYLRVSTDRQGTSGLGLEAQRETVMRHVNGHGELLAEYIEVESGRKTGRPELAKAMARAKEAQATLIFAKLDRLARSARFLLEIVESGVDIVFCDFPQIPPGPAGKFMITTMASVAELEAGLISERTKAALRACRTRGKKLGGPRTRDQYKRSVAARQAKANADAESLIPIIESIRAAGVTSLAGMARCLNDRGVKTSRGGQWHASSVKNVLQRAG